MSAGIRTVLAAICNVDVSAGIWTVHVELWHVITAEFPLKAHNQVFKLINDISEGIWKKINQPASTRGAAPGPRAPIELPPMPPTFKARLVTGSVKGSKRMGLQLWWASEGVKAHTEACRDGNRCGVYSREDQLDLCNLGTEVRALQRRALLSGRRVRATGARLRPRHWPRPAPLPDRRIRRELAAIWSRSAAIWSGSAGISLALAAIWSGFAAVCG